MPQLRESPSSVPLGLRYELQHSPKLESSCRRPILLSACPASLRRRPSVIEHPSMGSFVAHDEQIMEDGRLGRAERAFAPSQKRVCGFAAIPTFRLG
jgi:hypothetical protein